MGYTYGRVILKNENGEEFIVDCGSYHAQQTVIAVINNLTDIEAKEG